MKLTKTLLNLPLQFKTRDTSVQHDHLTNLTNKHHSTASSTHQETD